ncbi:MAG: transposase, partial [Dokdonella sp.]
YPWSSYACNAEGAPDTIVSAHAQFLALGRTDEERSAAYRALVRESISDEDLQAIRDYVQQQRALGSLRFQASIEAMTGRCASVRSRGRPPKPPARDPLNK